MSLLSKAHDTYATEQQKLQRFINRRHSSGAVFSLRICAENKHKRDRQYKKLSYCWETVRRESMQRIAEMDVEMTT